MSACWPPGGNRERSICNGEDNLYGNGVYLRRRHGDLLGSGNDRGVVLMQRRDRMQSLINRANRLNDYQTMIQGTPEWKIPGHIPARWIEAERVKETLYKRIGMLATVCLREVA